MTTTTTAYIDRPQGENGKHKGARSMVCEGRKYKILVPAIDYDDDYEFDIETRT